jgi:hypothetical protein
MAIMTTFLTEDQFEELTEHLCSPANFNIPNDILEHPDPAQFFARLGQCNHTLLITAEWLENHFTDPKDIWTNLFLLGERGGNCDCEVILNVWLSDRWPADLSPGEQEELNQVHLEQEQYILELLLEEADPKDPDFEVMKQEDTDFYYRHHIDYHFKHPPPPEWDGHGATVGSA